jgi:hypothetical protein
LKTNLIFIFFVFSFVSLAQNQVFNGKVIDQELIPLPAIQIKDEKGVLLGETDFDGRFQINLPTDTNKISFQGIDYQTEVITIPKDCSFIQLIVLNYWLFDFVSLKRAKKKLLKARKKELPLLYDEAFKKGIFEQKENGCIGNLQ